MRRVSFVHVTFLSAVAFGFMVAGLVTSADTLLRASLTLATLAVVEVLRLLVRCSDSVSSDAPSVTGARRAERVPSTKGWPWAPRQHQPPAD